MAADLTRSLAGGGPGCCMEHSTARSTGSRATSPSGPARCAATASAHVARGADGVMFFQWRASRSGAEKFHSAMLPHGGPTPGVARGRSRSAATWPAWPSARQPVVADVAVVWDWESWWALDSSGAPPSTWTPGAAEAYYEPLWRRHLTVDFVHPTADLTRVPPVVVPACTCHRRPPRRTCAATWRAAARCWCRSSPASSTERRGAPGRHPGALRDLLGLTVEEFLPLRAASGDRGGDRTTPAADR